MLLNKLAFLKLNIRGTIWILLIRTNLYIDDYSIIVAIYPEIEAFCIKPAVDKIFQTSSLQFRLIISFRLLVKIKDFCVADAYAVTTK